MQAIAPVCRRRLAPRRSRARLPSRRCAERAFQPGAPGRSRPVIEAGPDPRGSAPSRLARPRRVGSPAATVSSAGKLSSSAGGFGQQQPRCQPSSSSCAPRAARISAWAQCQASPWGVLTLQGACVDAVPHRRGAVRQHRKGRRQPGRLAGVRRVCLLERPPKRRQPAVAALSRPRPRPSPRYVQAIDPGRHDGHVGQSLQLKGPASGRVGQIVAATRWTT